MPRLHNLINNDELKRLMYESDEARTTLSFYQYHPIANPQRFRDTLYLRWNKLPVFGRIYIAHEGINGQISVPTSLLDAFKEDMYDIPFLSGIRLNIAIHDDGKSFFKLKIKVRDKIVADGLDDDTFNVNDRGTPLNAQAFNDLTSLPDTIVVDMRNHYESEVGYFENAIRPQVETFREALPLVEDMLAEGKEKNIVMYCTGGIRCEKASAYYKHRGFKNVFMVDGGIIEYARQCKEQSLPNKFIGKNFVFDERLGERISEAVVAQCHQCGQPCDTHINCANDACHLLFIQCPECAARYEHCCSETCRDFNRLADEEKQEKKPSMHFNGMTFGHGHYRAFRKDATLQLQ